MSTYMENLNQTRINYSESRLNKNDGKAWENRKKKGQKRYDPRGSVIKRIRKLDRLSWFNKNL